MHPYQRTRLDRAATFAGVIAALLLCIACIKLALAVVDAQCAQLAAQRAQIEQGGAQ